MSLVRGQLAGFGRREMVMRASARPRFSTAGKQERRAGTPARVGENIVEIGRCGRAGIDDGEAVQVVTIWRTSPLNAIFASIGKPTAMAKLR